MSIYYIILLFSIFSFFLGLVLSYSSYRFPFKKNVIIEEINDCFPQSQCGQCGYAGCHDYATEIFNQSVDIDKCTPGGPEIILQIANILNMEIPVKNTALQEKKIFNTVVWIDEKNCVGCSKCAIFCPVDAIVGAPNLMHTVLEKFCTGCNICLSHCPTNCIHIKINREII